jgi:hypothetical protein
MLAVLSLFVASVSACACTHHHQAEKVEAEVPSCHKPAHNEQPLTEITEAADASCECVLRAGLRVYAKHENLKVEKQALAITANDPRRDLDPAALTSVSANYVSPEIHLSTHYHNSSPGRAPPRL